MAVILEKPPLRETIILKPPSGGTYRWAEDDPKAENTPSNVSYGSSMPGGFNNFSARLPRKPGVDYQDMERLTEVTVLDASGAVNFEGYLERGGSQSGDEVAINPDAVGWQKYLDDNPNVNWLGVDIDQSNWYGPTIERQNLLRAFNVTPYGPSQGTSDNQVNVSLDLGFSGPFAGQQWAEAFYKAPLGQFVAGVLFNYAGRSSAPAPEPVAAFGGDISFADEDGLFTPAQVGTDFYTVNQGTGNASLFANDLWTNAKIRWTYGTAITADGYEYILACTNLQVLGGHGLTFYPVVGGQTVGLLASDVIKKLLTNHAPLINWDNDSIDTTSFVIPQSLGINQSLPDLITEHNKYELWDWAIWEGKKYYYNAPGNSEKNRRWKARVGPSNLQETGKDTRRLRNGVYVKYQGVDGSQKVVGPTGSAVTDQSIYLTDRNPENLANLANRTMYEVIDMGRVSSKEGAIQVGFNYLVMLQELDRSGDATIHGYIQDIAGNYYPHTAVRGGDTIEFVDAGDKSARRITEVSHNRDQRESQITLDAPIEGIQAILDRLGVSQTGLAL